MREGELALFGKREKGYGPEADTPNPSEAALGDVTGTRPEASAASAPRAMSVGATSIDASITVKGEILGDEDVTVDGRVEGIVNLTRDLVVGKSGVVEADVRAAAVVIHGRVTGNIAAEQKVEILSSGRLEGNIKSPKIVIAEGAHFKGNVDMTGASPGPGAGAREAAAKRPTA